MYFNSSTPIKLPTPEKLRLKCGSLRTAFLAFDMVFWLFTLVFLFAMAAHSNYAPLAQWARAVNDYCGSHTAAFMVGPGTIGITLLYFAYGRKTLSWQDGLIIDNKPKQLLSYQFKQFFGGVPLMYLNTTSGKYILYPVTSQDGRKFPDIKQMNKEMSANQVLVDVLQAELHKSGIQKAGFWFFTWDVAASSAVFILVMAAAFLS